MGPGRPEGTGTTAVGMDGPGRSAAGRLSPSSSSASSASDGDSQPLRMGWKGAVLILGFWTLFGSVMAASLLLSALSRTGDITRIGIVGFAFLGAYAWAALTVPLFHLTHRFDLTADQGTWRFPRIAGLVVFGVALAFVFSVSVAWLSSAILRDLIGRFATPGGIWEMARYRLLFDVLACQLVFTAGIARDYFIRYQTRLAEATQLRSRLVEAELQVLRTQLNPHFLFNTLNTVAALVQTDPRGVRRMIALLSDLLRSALAGASEPEVSLKHELEMLRSYLDIMEIRFRGRLQTRIDVDPDLLEGMVPHLILQPLVENAVKHGVSLAKGPASVHVSSTRDGDQMVLTVTNTAPDDGPSPGRRPSNDATAPDSAGIGLRNTRERLRQLYGEEATLRLGSTDSGHMIAEVRLPYHVDRVSIGPGPGLAPARTTDVASASPMDGAA